MKTKWRVSIPVWIWRKTFKMSLPQTLNQKLRRVPTWIVYIAGILPVAWLVYQLFTGGLGVDPVKAMEHKLGEIALQLLIAALVITPLRDFTGVNLIRFRRAIGLLGFAYVALHLTVWLVLDIQLLWGEIAKDILKRPYITIGMFAMLCLIPLAVTSNTKSIRKLGPLKWRRLHKLAYPATMAGGLHYVMLVKGWQIEPLIYFAAISLLLLARLRWRRQPSVV